MFFRRSVKSNELRLVDVVEKTFQSDFVFDRVNGDLGAASEVIMKNSSGIRMSYAYARRIAMAGLCVQGLVKKEVYDHVHSIFKSIQISTEHSVEFQEQALDDAVEFLQTYHHIVTRLFSNAVILIAQDYEVPSGWMNDDELVKAVLEFMHQNEVG